MKIALCQVNPTVADFAGNAQRVASAFRQAADRGADVVVFPEMVLPGYPPLDLLDRADFVEAAEATLAQLAPRLAGPPALIGTLRANPRPQGRKILNTAVWVIDGRIHGYYDKILLPTYDVFDEDRYFEPGSVATPFEVAGRRVGVVICEDLWNLEDLTFRKPYVRDPADELVRQGAEVLICPSASPFHRGKTRQRERLVLNQARRLGVPVLLANMVGGNTELIFDGNSLAAGAGGKLVRGHAFAEDVVLVEVDELAGSAAPADEPGAPDLDAREISAALVLGVRDYFRKCGFERAVIGLSGGIDSAVTAVIACEALGAERVRGMAMPSQYSSPGSLTDARQLAANLGMRLDTIPIEPVFEVYLRQLRPVFGDRPADVAEENLQARIRGALLMAVSNKFGEVLLTTGNKSELAVGYCTIYGDMAGGLAVIGDLPKTDVYRVARLPEFRPRIPVSTLEKAPSAELRPGQLDQDSLPPYEVLDPILEAYVERSMSRDDIVRAGFDATWVERILRMVELNEYKRRQAAPTLRVTPRAFGMGRRLPIARRI
ncbi:MAG: NAD+ synthase [Planctomycetota bacterium]